MRDVLARTVFTVGETEYRWVDVVAHAERSRVWDEIRRRAAEGVAALARVRVDQADEDQAATRFRYERNLIAGEEVEAWLARWELSIRDWRSYLRRTLARERMPTQAAGDVDERTLWAEAVCSGTLEREAHELAGRIAAADAVGDPNVDRAFERFRAEALTDAALTRVLAARPADWLRVNCRTLTFQDENAAREAALCIREDGVALAEVGVRAGLEVGEHRLMLGDTGPTLANVLLSARPGEFHGPVASGDGYVLVLVEDKIEPSLDDLEVRQRLE